MKNNYQYEYPDKRQELTDDNVSTNYTETNQYECPLIYFPELKFLVSPDFLVSYPQMYEFQNSFPRADDYSDMQSIVNSLPHLINVNNYNKRFDPVGQFKEAKCFVLRSDNDDDIHKVTQICINSYFVQSIKYQIWTSTPATNQLLDKTYNEQKNGKKLPILLFFTQYYFFFYLFARVMNTQQYVAIAQMVSPLLNKAFPYWWEPMKWTKQFRLRWIYIKDLPFKKIEGYNHNQLFDGQEIHQQQALEILKLMKKQPSDKSIFEAFQIMDIREDVLRNMRKINLIGMPYQYLFNPFNALIDNLKYGDTQKGPRMKQLPSEKDKNRIDTYLNNNNK